jgi:hypothetical protein
VPEITVVKEVNGKVWFGSPEGAFMLRNDGKYNYYYGERWLPGNRVIDISEGPDNSVLILTDKGLGQIFFKEITLAEKAKYFEKQVRLRHIRHGFNATLSGMKTEIFPPAISTIPTTMGSGLPCTSAARCSGMQ